MSLKVPLCGQSLPKNEAKTECRSRRIIKESVLITYLETPDVIMAELERSAFGFFDYMSP